MAEAILAGGAAAAGAWRPWRVRAGPWRRRQPRGHLDAALVLPHGRIRAGRGISSLPAGASLPGRERRAAPALLAPFLCGGMASSSACVASSSVHAASSSVHTASSSTGPRATATSSRRRRMGLGVWPPFLSLLSLSLYLSLSCGCRIRLRGAVTRRPELGPAAGPRGARSLVPALRGASGAWPRSAALRSGPRGGWARPAAGRCSPDGRARFFFMTWPRSPVFFWCGNRK